MSAHTPGPWALETVTTSCGICHKIGPFPARRDSDSPRHACLYSDNNSTFNPADQELLANAHLIAAAPDLLEALQLFVAWSEAERNHEGTTFWGRVEMLTALDASASAAIAKATGE